MQDELDKFKIDPKHIAYMEHIGLQDWKEFQNLCLKDIPCTCKGELQNAAKKILPTADNTHKIVVFNNCARTLKAAARRQMREQPLFCPYMMNGANKTQLQTQRNMMTFEEFVDNIFEKEIIPILDKFGYNVNEWMNHLTAKKQKEVLGYHNGDTIKPEWMTEYSMFCKREKQIQDTQDKMPKNRAIACPHNAKKYVCGPIIWALETLFAKDFKGYCGGKNWDELENLFTQYYHEGFTHTFQGDGSAFDSTQTFNLKYVDRLIYNYLIKQNKIKHVDVELFEKAMNAIYKTIELKIMSSSKVTRLGKIGLNGTVFSGDPDTTFGNTLRMSLYIRYTMYLAGYHEDHFRLVCKGDDFVVFASYLIKDVPWENYKGFGSTKYKIDKNDPHYAIKTAFYQVWHPADDKTQLEEHKGLGMVLKFLKVGNYEDIDFCSTHVIHMNKNTGKDTFKIVRQVNRMSPLNHWCCKALGYSKHQMKQYYIDLALSMRSWANDMPLFKDYIYALEEHAKMIKPEGKDKTPKVESRMLFDVNPLIYGPLRGYTNTEKYDKYDNDFVYMYLDRVSKRKPTDDEVYEFLLEKYNISKLDINKFGKHLSNTLWLDPTNI